MKVIFGKLMQLAICIWLLPAFCVSAQDEIAENELTIMGGNYFDTESGEFKPNPLMRIVDGKISHVTGSYQGAVNRMIMLKPNDYILPGLIDLHAHYNMTLVKNRREEFNATPIIYLANGATVTFTAGEYMPEKMFELRKRLEAGKQTGPRLITSGPYFGMARPGWRNDIPSAEKIREEVDYWVERGVGGFKAKLIDPDSLKVLIEQAHKHGLTVTGHLDSGFRNSVNPRDAINMGIDRIEHFLGGDAMPDNKSAYASLATITSGTPEFKAITQLFIDKGVYFDATISAYGYIGARGDEYEYWMDEREFFTPYVQQLVEKREHKPNQQFEKIYQAKQTTIADYFKAGGLITLGTDHNSDGTYLGGFGIHREMDVMVRSGIPEAEVIKIATINGAKAMKIDKDHGSIEVGKSADLYVVTGNPLENIRNTRNGKYVICAGKIHEPAKLLESVKGTIGPNDEEEAKHW